MADLSDWEPVAPTKKPDLSDWEPVSPAKPAAAPKDPREVKKEAAATREKPKDEGFTLPGSHARALVKQVAMDAVKGIGENVASAVSSVGAGLAGLASLPVVGADRAANIVRKGTYEPRTPTGKDIATVLSAPIQRVGQEIGTTIAEPSKDMARSAGASSETQAKIEAGARTIGENALPIAMTARALPGAVKNLVKSPSSAEIVGPPVPRELPPEQMTRYKRLSSQGYEPTLGQVTREPEQFKFEEHTAQRAEVGRDMLDRKIDQNAQLAKNVEKQYPAGTTQLPDSAVGSLIRKATEAKRDIAWQGVKDKYAKANAAGETKALVNATPILDFLEANKAEMTSVPALESIATKTKTLLSRVGENAPPRIVDAKGNVQSPGKAMISIDDIENLRRAAGDLGEYGKPSYKFMSQVQDLIDKVTEGAGGDLYKDARQSARQFYREFKDQGGVRRITDKASETDYKVDDSKLWNQVVNGSVEDLKQTLNTLRRDVKPGDKSTAAVDQAAIKALQRKSMESVLDNATKSATKDAKGNPEFSPAAFKKSLDSVGRDKLNELWGKDSTDQMYRIVDDAIELKTAPARVAGSPTMTNAQMLADRVFTNRALYALEHVTSKMGLPLGVLRWAREGLAKSAENAATKAATEEALNPMREPVLKAREREASTNAARRQIRMQEGAQQMKGPAVSAITMQQDKKKKEEQP